MHVEYTPGQIALRREFRAYPAGLMTPEEREQMRHNREGGEFYRTVMGRMGRDGWLTPGWPVEYGGRALDPLAQKVVMEELWLAETPFPFVTVNTVGPALIRRGTEQQKREFLPRIARGEIIFSFGYTEPSAGSDLASLRTRAERDGGHFVINGQKIFPSGVQSADYVWLAARTDPHAPPHKGITIFVLDTRLPGFSFTPIHTVGDVRTNVSFYENVRVQANMIFGELNAGWQLITEQLNHERVGLAVLAFGAMGCFDQTVGWARATKVPDCGHVIDRPWVQLALAGAGLIGIAIAEEHGGGDPLLPAVKATAHAGGWRLRGVKACVPYAAQAHAILVSARTGKHGVGVFLVDPKAKGVRIEAQATTSGEPQAQVRLTNVQLSSADVLGDPANGADIVRWMIERGHAALAAEQVGLMAEALRSVYLRAVWALESGIPATAEVAAAKWWTARGGHRVTHTAQHLHGGMGADVDYPIHAFFLRAKQIDLALGGAAPMLAMIGEQLASRGVRPMT